MRQARSTKADTPCSASATWNAATQASKGAAAASTAASSVYNRATASRARNSVPPVVSANASASCSPRQPRRRASRASRAPTRWATRVMVALDKASGTMNISDARLDAIWWPPEAVTPSRAMNTAIRLNALTSTTMARPIGTPSRSWAPMARRSGPSSPRPRSEKAS